MQGFIIPQVDPSTIDAPPAGYTALVADLTGRLTLVQPDGTISPIDPTNQMSAEVVGSSSAGAQTVGPGNGCHTVVATISGLAGVRQFALDRASLTPAAAGYRIKVVFLCPNTVQGIRLQVFDANTNGQLLFDWTTDGIQANAFGDFHYSGAVWQLDDAKAPASI